MRRPNLPVTFQMQRGDMQFVNNQFILHSRTEYEDYPEPERKRHYMRLWLKYFDKESGDRSQESE